MILFPLKGKGARNRGQVHLVQPHGGNAHVEVRRGGREACADHVRDREKEGPLHRLHR